MAPTGQAAISPVVAAAAGHVDEAARALAAAAQVDWVSDAADRYRAALDEAQQAVARTARDVDTAYDALRQHDRATALACVAMRADAAYGLLGQPAGRQW
ncbi:hypothetical protein [Cellulomonas timonensis]|uniref:hypothetical protein n=1 Tax=Cellulomonas timonensis TaxID=1689271 RepID=UPI00082A86CF|nr:hypothetical protein [Cellulomonas timonensis]